MGDSDGQRYCVDVQATDTSYYKAADFASPLTAGAPSAAAIVVDATAGSAGVAVPDAGVALPDGAVPLLGPATSPSGSSKYAFKKVRQFALEGRKCPPSCSSTREFLDTSMRLCALSAVIMTSVRPMMCSVGVEYPPSKTFSEKAPTGLKPAAAIQNVLEKNLE